MKNSISLSVLILVASGVLAQNPEKQSTKKVIQAESGYGAVHGRVFAVTNDGDLKPGRFVRVYLFFGSKISGNHVIDSDIETPTLVFMKARNEQIEQWNREGEKALAGLSPESIERLSCKHGLIADDKAIVTTIDSSSSKGTTSGIFATETDEEGQFALKRVPAGQYLVVARGQAGINDVYWQQFLWVHPSATVEAKISDVQDACARIQ